MNMNVKCWFPLRRDGGMLSFFFLIYLFFLINSQSHIVLELCHLSGSNDDLRHHILVISCSLTMSFGLNSFFFSSHLIKAAQWSRHLWICSKLSIAHWYCVTIVFPAMSLEGRLYIFVINFILLLISLCPTRLQKDQHHRLDFLRLKRNYEFLYASCKENKKKGNIHKKEPGGKPCWGYGERRAVKVRVVLVCSLLLWSGAESTSVWKLGPCHALTLCWTMKVTRCHKVKQCVERWSYKICPSQKNCGFLSCCPVWWQIYT